MGTSANPATGSFHAAFDTGVPDTLPRESIEVRLIAFR